MTGPKIIRNLERGLTVSRPYKCNRTHRCTSCTSSPASRSRAYCASYTPYCGPALLRLGDGRYRIGSNLSHTPSRREHRDRIAEAAAPILVRLCQRVSWPSDLMVPAGDHMEIRETSRTRKPNLVAAGAHWTASRLAFDCSRAGLSRLLSRQGASTCDQYACARRPDLKIAWRATRAVECNPG